MLPSKCLALPALGHAPCQPAPLLVHRRETYFPVRHCELPERRGREPQPQPCGTRAGAEGDTARYLLRLCWMVSRSSVTLRLLPEKCRGMYSVCDTLGGERTEAVRADHRQPNRTTHSQGLTSEIPVAGRSFWRRNHPRCCCTLAATGSRCWSRRGAGTRLTRSALWGWSRGSVVLRAQGLPSFPPPQLPVPHRSPARRSSGSSQPRRHSARGCACSSQQAPCTRCRSVTART